MRFALLGDHPDGLETARALVRSGRHRLLVYSGSALGLEELRRDQLEPATVADLEEVLADPAIDFVIVASGPALRSAQLKRVLQSERHALCVHPVHAKADAAYEASMLQADARVILLPILPEPFHPAVLRLAQIVRERAPGPWHLTLERQSLDELFATSEEAEPIASLPGWDVLRRIGGEIVEVFALAQAEELTPDQPLAITGRFATDGLLQAHYRPMQPLNRWRLSVELPTQDMELIFPQGWPGAAELTLTDVQGQRTSESFPGFDPWLALVDAFEQELVDRSRGNISWSSDEPRLGWTDAIRSLELDENVRRSLHYRRAYTLDFQEATEETSFKGTMTLIGCSMIWISLLLLILSQWVPWMGWLIPFVFGAFLLMQLFRWAIPRE